MKSTFFTLLVLFRICICDDVALLEKRSSFSLSSDGPILTISVSWDRFPCPKDWRSYWINLCGPDRICTSSQPRKESERVDTQLIFWTTYTIEILARCELSTYILWSRREFDTGPGELAPLINVRSVVGTRRATMIWQKWHVNPNVADYVEIMMCEKNSTHCLDTIRTSPNPSEYTFEDLLPGVEYVASLSVVKKFHGEEYRSRPWMNEFRTSHHKVPGAPQGVSITTLHGLKVVRWDNLDTEFEGITASFVDYMINATAFPSRERTFFFPGRPVFELLSLRLPDSRYRLEISNCVYYWRTGYQCGPSAHLEIPAKAVGYPNRPEVELLSQNIDSVLFFWRQPTEPRGPIDGYEYAYGRKDDSFTPSNWISLGPNKRLASVKKLEADTTYVFHVVAFNLDSKRRKLYSLPGVLVVRIEGK